MNIWKFLPIFLQEILINIEGKKRKSLRFLNDYFIRWATLLNNSRSWSDSKIEQFRKERLSWYLFTAYTNSDYWNIEMRKISDNPKKEIMANPETFLKKLPKISKKVILSNKKAFINRSKKSKDYIMVHTSGTTGAGLVFPWSLEALAAEFAFIWFRRYHSVLFGDKMATFNGNKVVPFEQTKPPFWRRNVPMNQTIFSIFHLKKQFLPAYIEELSSGNYIFINGYPSAIYEVARFILDNALALNIKYVFPSSESLYEWQREAISRAFDCLIFDSYTNTEQSAMIYECPNGTYHLSEEYSFVELEPVSNSESKNLFHIVGTNWLNDSMFLIRYETGDFVKASPKTSCICGERGLIVDQIIGRQDDVIYTADGRAVGRLDHLFKNSEDLKAAQIVQEDYGRLTIRYIPRQKSFNSKKFIEKEIKQRLGKNTIIKFVKVDSLIKDNSGKVRGVISKIGENKT